VTPELLQFLPKAIDLFPLSKEDEVYSTFECIGKMSIKQWLLPRLGNGKIKNKVLINSVYDHCNAFFQAAGHPRDFGFDLDKTIAHVLYTDDDSRNNFQNPHTDFPFVMTRRNLKDRARFSWVAHMPLTEEGSWNTIWWGSGLGYTLQICCCAWTSFMEEAHPMCLHRTDKKQFR
jgi:hypothetical protein